VCVPESDGFVVAAGRKDTAVGRPCQRGYTSQMTFERVFEGAGEGVPEFDGAVAGARGNPAAVGREAHDRDGFLVASEYQGGFVME
jgi:hypothetical protein